MMSTTAYPIADGFQEILDDFVYRFVLEEDQVVAGKKSIFNEVYLPLLRSQGVQFVNMAIGGDYVPQIMYSNAENRFWDAHKKLDALTTELDAGCESFILCQSEADIDRAIDEKKIGIFATISGGRPLEGKQNINLLSSLRSLYRAGLRSLQLTGNGRNRLADGVAQERSRGKLTDFGVKVVREAERLGMVIDSSQLSDHGFYDLAEVSAGPIIDSHTACEYVCSHPRNISDERIKVMAERGGVVGISFRTALLAGTEKRGGAEDLIRHIDHVASIAGTEHLMLSPDYSAYTTPVCRDKLNGYANRGPDFCEFDRRTPTRLNKHPGWVEGVWYGLMESDFIAGPDSHEGFPLAVEALRTKAGFCEEELENILGGNLLRVFRTVLS